MEASEGADRVAQRLGERPIAMRAIAGETPFCCEACGAHVFAARRSSLRTWRHEFQTACTCGRCKIASTRVAREAWRIFHVGSLGNDHLVAWRHEPQKDALDYKHDDLNVYCRECHDASDQEALRLRGATPSFWGKWDIHVTVECAACGHEIEFGWSSPDLVGEIWPCESVDFDPNKCWPEIKYRFAWARRGWLRPVPSAG